MLLSDNLVILKPLKVQDVSDEYLNWLNSPEISFGLSRRNYTMKELIDYVKEKTKDPHCVFFAILDKKTNQHIGNIKLDNFDKETNLMDLGILIGNKNFWGKGYGKSACILMIDYGFNVMNLRKIWLAVYENNPAARILYEKLGFVTEGILRKHVYFNGSFYDKYIMGIFKDEWNQKNK